MVEMIAVIIVVGILSASAATKYGGSGTIAERSYRAEMMSAAKYAQQQAMHDTALTSAGNARQRCYRFYSSGGVFGPQILEGAGAWAYPDQAEGTEYPASLGEGVTSPGTEIIYFDSLGNSVSSCALDASTTSNTVSLIGETTVQFTVESTGYIHAI